MNLEEVSRRNFEWVKSLKLVGTINDLFLLLMQYGETIVHLLDIPMLKLIYLFVNLNCDYIN